MRRAVAIQLIINKELGLNFNENPWQGSFIVDKLTDIVEEAVYKEFEAISERGGVLGAMDTMYQRGKIQEESPVLRAQEARRLAAADRRQHLPAEGARRRDRHRDRADPLDGRGEGPADRERRRLPGRARNGLATEEPEAAAGHGARAPQRVRAADGGGEDTLAWARSAMRLYDVGGEYRRNM